ncbi:E3 ubiquitin-protein ligase SIRP1-like [Vicia villosa]|uniref:E3 ubiquitin-protein ligase SIRP1-like n=1 Tax=Vicia villosa TaxID=3911 RepID=UPI00273B52AB|nr:E3 ubiquitin-protein ligase SIRP1-like [Vicia villosa]
MENEQWCTICSKMVSPLNEYENKCPFCDTQFGDGMENLSDHHNNDAIDLRSAWVFSLYAPIFLGLMNAFTPSLATISSQENITSRNDEDFEQERGNYNELVIGRRRRTSTYMMHLFRGLHVRMVSENENIEQNRNIIDNNNNIVNNNNNNNSNNNSILVIDPFNEGALIVRGPNLNHTNLNRSNENNISTSTIGSLNDFVDGSGFDLLLQQLAQITPSGYASVNPPTKKEAIEAMENMINDEKLQCTICLEDVEIGNVTKEMPCKHKFHSDCIVSWLKLHSSCPVCRFQMPCEDSNVLANLENGNREVQNNEVVRRGRNGRRNWFPVLQSFNNFLPFP